MPKDVALLAAEEMKERYDDSKLPIEYAGGRNVERVDMHS
jgi:hypothetical protein